jgi:hypothetical protein
LSADNQKLHESIVQLQKDELMSALKHRRHRAMLDKVDHCHDQKVTPEKQALIFSGKAFTAHEAVELGSLLDD